MKVPLIVSVPRSRIWPTADSGTVWVCWHGWLYLAAICGVALGLMVGLTIGVLLS